MLELARAHGCQPGCPGCASEQAQSPAVGLLVEWTGFVTSRGARRAGRLSARTGRPFPVMTTDDVTQFCIEEAVAEAVAFEDRHRQLAEETARITSSVGPMSEVSPHEKAGIDHARRMSELKGQAA